MRSYRRPVLCTLSASRPAVLVTLLTCSAMALAGPVPPTFRGSAYELTVGDSIDIAIRADGGEVASIGFQSASWLRWHRAPGGLLTRVHHQTNLPGGATSMAYSVDGDLYVGFSSDGSVRRVDSFGIQSILPTSPTDGRLSSPGAVAVTPDGSEVWAAGLSDSRLYIWDISDPHAIAAARVYDLALVGVRSIEFSPGGGHAYLADLQGDAVVVVRRTASGPVLAQRVENGALGVSGLDGPYDIAVAADGRDVYVGTFTSDTVVHFAVDATARLQFREAQVAVGDLQLDAVFGVDVSDDGRHVLAVGGDSNSVVVFARGSAGALTQISGIEAEDLLEDSLINPVTVESVGANVYVGTLTGRSVLMLRLEDSGALVPAQVLPPRDEWVSTGVIVLAPDGSFGLGFGESPVDGAATCVVFHRDPVSGGLIPHRQQDLSSFVIDPGVFWGAALSPDGRHLVLGGKQDLYVFDHDNSDHSLQPNSTVLGGIGGVPGTAQAYDMKFSADGRQLYLIDYSDDQTVTWLSRNPLDGQLSYRDSLEGFLYPYRIALGPASDVLYVADSGASEVVAVRSNLSTSTLEILDRERAVQIPTLADVRTLLVSDDGLNLYAAGGNGGLAVFDIAADGTLSHADDELLQGGNGPLSGEAVLSDRDGGAIHVLGKPTQGMHEVLSFHRHSDGTLNLSSRRPAAMPNATVLAWKEPFRTGGEVNLASATGLLVFSLDGLFGDDFESGDLLEWSGRAP